MAQAPIMPLFTDALIGDTLNLTAEQFGAYCLLLIATWRNNGKALPDDDKELSTVCRVSVKHWQTKLRPVLARFFSTEGHWHQKRLEKEWAYVQQKVEKNRESGAAGGRANALKYRKPRLANAKANAEANALANPDPDSSFNNLENLGYSAREARSAPPAADAASAVTEALPEQFVTAEEVDAVVAVALAGLNGTQVRNGAAHKATVTVAKHDAWLNNLATFVAERFDGAARMQAWEMIETARAARSRAKTPKPVRSALDDLDKLYRSHQNGDAR